MNKAPNYLTFCIAEIDRKTGYCHFFDFDNQVEYIQACAAEAERWPL